MHVWTVLCYVTFGGDKGGGVAVIAGASRAADAVHVVVDGGGHVVVDDHDNIGDIHAARTDVCSNEDHYMLEGMSASIATKADCISSVATKARTRWASSPFDRSTSTSMLRFSLLRSLSFQRPLKSFLRLTFSLSVVDEHASLLALVARVQDLCKP
jgi:hypothetical protein